MATYYWQFNKGDYIENIYYSFNGTTWYTATSGTTYQNSTYSSVKYYVKIPSNTAQYTYKTNFPTSKSSATSISGSTSKSYPTKIKPFATRTLNSYTITVTAGTGGTASGGGTYTYGSKAKLEAKEDEGYKFLKWSDGGDQSHEVEVTGTESYAASFKKITYTLTYKANGHGSDETQSKDYGDTVYIKSYKTHTDSETTGATISFSLNDGSGTTPSDQKSKYKLRYSSSQWNTNSSGTGTKYTAGAEYSKNSNLTLYAIWNEPETTWSDFTMPSQSGISKTGYDPDGWNTSDDGSGKNFTAGKTYNPSDHSELQNTRKLYVKWKIKSYSVKIGVNNSSWGLVSVNGGTKTSEWTGTVNYGSKISVSAEPEAHCSFDSWSDWEEGPNPRDIIIYGSTSITANFSRIIYKVTYDGNGGSTPSPQTGYYGDTLTGKSTWEGGSLNGWWTKKSGGTQRTKIEGTETLYAHWNENNWNIKYNSDGGSYTPEDDLIYYSEEFYLPNTTPTKYGHTFKGWKADKGSTKTWSAGSLVKSANQNLFNNLTDVPSGSTVTFTAQWEELPKYNIIVQSDPSNLGNVRVQTSSGWSSWSSKWEGEVYQGTTLPIEAKEKTDVSTWLEWSTGSTDRSTNVYIYKDNTYTANFKAITHKITLNKNGGSGGTDSITTTYSLSLPDITVPSWQWRIFEGYLWYPEGGEERYIYGPDGKPKLTSSPFKSDDTLYAQWSESYWYIKYTGQGDPKPDSKKITYSQSYSIPNVTPILKGHTFKGWSDSRYSYTWKIGDIVKTIDEPLFDLSSGSTLTFTSIFEVNKITISAHYNDGSGIVDEVSATYGQKLPHIDPPPSREYYYFMGYYTSGGTQIYNANGDPIPETCEFETNVDLWGHWGKIFTVTIPTENDVGTEYFYIYKKEGSTAFFKEKTCENIITHLDISPISGSLIKYKRYIGYYDSSDTVLCVNESLDITSEAHTVVTGNTTWKLRSLEVAWINFDVANENCGTITPEAYWGYKRYDVDTTVPSEDEQGRIQQIMAVPLPGWEFNKWIRHHRSGEETEITSYALLPIKLTKSNIDSYRDNSYVAYFKMKSLYIKTIDSVTGVKAVFTGGNKNIQEGNKCILTVGMVPIGEDYASEYVVDYFKRRIKDSPPETEWEEIIPGETYKVDDNKLTFTVTEETAKWEYSCNIYHKYFNITTVSDFDGVGVVTGSGRYQDGDWVHLKAVEMSAGSKFLGWYGEYAVIPISEEKEYSFKLDTSLFFSRKITGKFKVKIPVTVYPERNYFVADCLDESEEGYYKNGDYLEYEAYVRIGFEEYGEFKYWEKNNVFLQNDPHIKYKVTRYDQLKAVFDSKQGEYTITVTSNDPEHCITSGSGKYNKDENVYISCIPDSGYKFDKWNDGNLKSSRNIIVSGNATYTGNIIKEEESKWEPRKDDTGIDESVYYLPTSDPEGIGIPLGYNTYCGIANNPIANKLYRSYHPEYTDVVYSNCTWYACGRTGEIAGMDLSDISQCLTARNWYGSGSGLDGAYTGWEREGFNNLPDGSRIENIQLGDILCFYSSRGGAGHVEIVEDIDLEHDCVLVSFGRYAGMTKSDGQVVLSDESRMDIVWIEWPLVNRQRVTAENGEDTRGYNWPEEVLQGVIHNPYSKNGGLVCTVKVRGIPADAVEYIYVDDKESVSIKKGSTVTLRTKALPGHTFKKWWDGNTKEERTYEVKGSVICWAYFDNFDPDTQVYIETGVSPEGVGSVTPTNIYNKGDLVTLEAKVYTEMYPDFVFTGWSTGDRDNPLSFIAEENGIYIAKFNNSGQGSDDPGKSKFVPSYGKGTKVEFTEISLNIWVYKQGELGQTELCARPMIKVIVGEKIYEIPYSETDLNDYKITIDPGITTDNLQILIGDNYSTRDSISVNSIYITYYGWDKYDGKKLYTRYYNGSDWTEWAEEA